MKPKIFKLSTLLLIPGLSCFSWEDKPGSEDHREQDRLFKDAQHATGANEHEKKADRSAWKSETNGQDNSKYDKENSGTMGSKEKSDNRDR